MLGRHGEGATASDSWATEGPPNDDCGCGGTGELGATSRPRPERSSRRLESDYVAVYVEDDLDIWAIDGAASAEDGAREPSVTRRGAERGGDAGKGKRRDGTEKSRPPSGGSAMARACGGALRRAVLSALRPPAGTARRHSELCELCERASCRAR